MVKKVFSMKLCEIQPSQLYICCEKLHEVMKKFNTTSPKMMEPIPVKKLDGDIIIVDGHTRAFAAFLCGFSEVPVYWECEELDWDAYKICVEWCKSEGIHTIADLKNRVIPQIEYEKLWYDRCERMQQDLEAKRKKHKPKLASLH
ncbi:MAG: ParB/Srx family N-terminal domain-containing protein [Candidatus Bathyarchaeia archaeon]